MKKTIFYAVTSAIVLFSLIITGCSDDDDNNVNGDIIEGPSAGDKLTIPADESFLGDSIRYMHSFALSEHNVKRVIVSTNQNGHIAILGGYKDFSAIYVYAKLDDDEKENLNDDVIKDILEKYYDIESEVNNDEIIVNVTKKKNIEQGDDFRPLRISIKVFTPANVSTTLDIARGSIVAKDVKGNKHTANSVSGAIKYINSYGKNFSLTSETGYVGLINTSASALIDAKVAKGTIQIVAPQNTKSTLHLKSSTKVNAYVLNKSNFKGTNTFNTVSGELNGGGYKINADSGIGTITFRWYEND